MRLFLYMFVQTAMMAFGQVWFKIGLQRFDDFTWTWSSLVHTVFLNGYMLLGLSVLVIANVLWLYFLKIFPFSIIYPLTSLGFVIGMLAGMLILGETVVWSQWFGVCLILAGCFFIVR